MPETQRRSPNRSRKETSLYPPIVAVATCGCVDLAYRTVRWIEDLALDECTIRSAAGAEQRAWWQLWAWVRRADTGEPFYVTVPVNPNGPYVEVGPSGRRTWGLARVGETDWQVSPSIDVVGDLRQDGMRGPSLWHETPRVVGVPPGERWTIGTP